MTRLMSAAAAIAVLALSATTALAAGGGNVSISKVSGGVLVNQGKGFRPATPGMVLHPGDRVLVTLNGAAGLNFGSACGVSLGGGSMATISGASPCTSGARNAGIVTPSLQSNALRPNLGRGGGPIGVLGGLGGGGQSSSPP